MLGLEYATGPEWVQAVLPHRAALLIEQAHLEKKAASSAISFLFRYPDEISLQAPLAELAREELEHFEQVLALLAVRGIRFGRQKPGTYAARLTSIIRPKEPDRMLDHLLCNAVIEARSCERMRLLAQGLAEVDPELAEFYRGLLGSEARHHGLFVELAKGVHPPEAVEARLEEILAHEAGILSAAGPRPRLHS